MSSDKQEEMTMDDRPIPDEWIEAAARVINPDQQHPDTPREACPLCREDARRVLAAVRPLIEQAQLAHLTSDRECDRIIDDFIASVGDPSGWTSEKVQLARWHVSGAIKRSAARLREGGGDAS